MGLIMNSLTAVLRKPTIGGIISELFVFAVPLWVAVFVGLVVAWAWKPRWVAGLIAGGRRSCVYEHQLNPTEGSNGYELPLAPPSLDSSSARLPNGIGYLKPKHGSETYNRVTVDPTENEELAVTLDDLRYLDALVDMTDGGPAWIQMMDRSLPKMSYKAWRRDPVKGPPQYRSRTIFEDAAPQLVRDFFWDDEFRIKNKWDDMLLYHSSLKECAITGTMLVHWIRKFPFFCSDREYIIGRRIWQVDGAYYCVTKGVPYTAIPRQNKPRRVDLYYSSWCIRAAESQRDERTTACEVLLFHYEDMGIPWEIAKLGVRQGMWGCVKRIEPGLRAYQAARKANEPLSRCAAMAQINTKVSLGCLLSLGACSESYEEIAETEKAKPWGKLLLVGGVVALACSLDRGLLTKAIIFGVARRFARIGRRL
ncbi:hypothetical protein HPP92_003522 [Vanilla planifolia]|uniref:START domain-containing protein n=1 Tax=Vanilla planifolia TaxID=51239 RepID=A0A835RV20_VANPL|nr:hypothetical protein HPP92_003522 [Vanilla planifolia]